VSSTERVGSEPALADRQPRAKRGGAARLVHSTPALGSGTAPLLGGPEIVMTLARASVERRVEVVGALQRTSGNRAVTRLLSRAVKDPPAPTTAPATAEPIALDTPPAVPDRRFGSAPLDPELVERARQKRLTETDLSEESFERNIAVIAYTRDRKLHYEVVANDPSRLHSESIALKNIEQGDPHWMRTKIVGVYSERQPCAGCASDLRAVRARVGVDFSVHYSVGQWEPKNTRATELRARYTRSGRGTGRTGGGSSGEGGTGSPPAPTRKPPSGEEPGSKVPPKRSAPAEGAAHEQAPPQSRATEAHEQERSAPPRSRQPLMTEPTATDLMSHPAVVGTIAHLGAGLVGNILTGWFHGYMADQVAQLKFPPIDRRSVLAYYSDPRVKGANSLMQVIHQDFPTFEAELQDFHERVVGLTNTELALLATSGRSHSSRAAYLGQMDDELDGYINELGILADNIDDALTAEPQAEEAIRSADELIAWLFSSDSPTWKSLVSAWLFYGVGLQIEEITGMESALRGLRSKLKNAFGALHSAGDRVHRLRHEISRLAGDVNRLYLVELAAAAREAVAPADKQKAVPERPSE